MANEIRIRVEADNASSAPLRRVRSDVQDVADAADDATRSMDRMGDVGERSARDIDQATDRAERSVTELGDSAERTMHDIDQAADRAANSVQEVGQAGEHGGGAMDVLRERGGGALDSITGGAGTAGEALSALGPYGKAAAVAIGLAMLGAKLAIDAVIRAGEAALDRADQLAVSKAYLGLDAAQAKQFGKVAAEVYMDQWGETLKQAGDAVRNAALYIMPTADKMKSFIQPTLKVVAEQVQALADTMGEDSKRVAFAVGQMLKSGMAHSTQEAFDLLHHAIAIGIDGMDDLLDSMGEYGALMNQTGLSSKTLFGIFKQGMDNAAFGTDKLADALKEMRLRITGGGTSIDTAFKDLGLNAKDMTKAISEGGPKAALAIDAIFDAIRKLNGTDAQKAALAIQNLFGGPGEDLGSSMFVIDPSEAEKAFGDIAGAADAAAARLSDKPFNAVDAYSRKWEMFQADIGDKVAPTFDLMLSAGLKLADALKPFVEFVLKDMAKAWHDNEDGIKKFAQFADEVLVPLLAGGIVVAIGAVAAAFEVVIGIMGKVGETWEVVRVGFAAGVIVILSLLNQVVQAAAIAFGWIPGLGPKLKDAAKNFQSFVDDVNGKMAKILDKTVHLTVEVNQRGSASPDINTGLPNRGGHRIMGSGGIGGAGLTIVNDGGPELIDFASGRVANFQQTRRALASANGMGGGSGGGVVLQLRDTGRGGWVSLIREAVNRGELEFTADLDTGSVRVA